MLSAKKQIVTLLQEEMGEKIGLDDLEYSPYADLSSNVCFKLARKLGKPPAEIAQEISKKIKNSGFVERADAKNGFLNFFLDYEKFGLHVIADALREDFGRGSLKKKKVVLEHTSVNPSGPVHVGRLRNSIIGDSLRRILSYAGYEVETHYWVNDVGKQIALISLAERKGLDADEEALKNYADYKSKEDFQVFFKYVLANKKFEDDEEFQDEVQNLIHAAEGGDKNSMDSIKSAASTCLKGQRKTYDRLGFKFDRFDFESEEIESGRVFKLLEKLKKTSYWTSKGDVGGGLDLSSLGVEKRSGLSVLVRSDGTTVYLARDISYHMQKLEQGDILINVLGEDHKLEFEELSAILKKILKVEKPVEVVHFSFVNFEGKKLSTRRGETLPVDQLLGEACSKALAEIKKRGIGSPETASAIGIGAVKYHIIKTAPTKPITFRWEDALSFDGDAAPYIQYAHARSARIIEKSSDNPKKIKTESLDLSDLSAEEKTLIKEISRFQEIVEKAADERKPHLIANYIYGLAAEYSRFYKECQVLTDDEKVRLRRLSMVYAAKNTIKIGLNLLGIEAPQRM